MAIPTASKQPKRVILRLRVNEFDGPDSFKFNDAIKTYLAFAERPLEELELNIHFAHIEPFQDPELQQTSFHITLDIEKNMLHNPNVKDLPHEVYRIRPNNEGNL